MGKMRVQTIFALGLLCMGLASPVRADSLPLGSPDINAGIIQLNYSVTGSVGTFTAWDTASNFLLNHAGPSSAGSFFLNASIDLSGATPALLGTKENVFANYAGSPSVTLESGSLDTSSVTAPTGGSLNTVAANAGSISFSYDYNSTTKAAIAQFVFVEGAGGSVPQGTEIAAILHIASATDLSTGFSNTGMFALTHPSTADIAPVAPLPNTIVAALSLFGLIGGSMFVRRVRAGIRLN